MLVRYTTIELRCDNFRDRIIRKSNRPSTKYLIRALCLFLVRSSHSSSLSLLLSTQMPAHNWIKIIKLKIWFIHWNRSVSRRDYVFVHETVKTRTRTQKWWSATSSLLWLFGLFPVFSLFWIFTLLTWCVFWFSDVKATRRIYACEIYKIFMQSELVDDDTNKNGAKTW